MKQPSITHACGHLKKRRPPSILSVHICTKQSSPCLHFGHGSLVMWWKLKHWFRKGIRSKRPLPYYGVSLSSPFSYPKTIVLKYWCGCRLVTSFWNVGRALLLGCRLLSRMSGQRMRHLGNPRALATCDLILAARYTMVPILSYSSFLAADPDVFLSS